MPFVNRQERRIRRAELLASLPPEWGEKDLMSRIQRCIHASGRKVVVLDDDPTGTQTVHNVSVLTVWSTEVLQRALASEDTVFYLLTNTRSYPEERAVAVNRDVAGKLALAAQRSNCQFEVVSRSDSTLRGHYPGEVEALRSALENRLGITYDGEIIAPFFSEGGRLTVHDVHWVAEGDWMVPAAQTEYAQDPVFGYRCSNLAKWVEEKTKGQVTANSVISMPLDLTRTMGPSAVAATLQAVTGGRRVIVNAATYRDMEVFVLGLLEAEQAGKQFILRTGASFVRVRGGIKDRGPLAGSDLFAQRPPGGAGGLIIVGSYVKRTTEQLELAQKLDRMVSVELNVQSVLNPQTRGREIQRVAGQLEEALAKGCDALVSTSREPVTGRTEGESFGNSQRVSEALVQVVRAVQIKPRFVVAKGGITSSDIGTKALDVAQAVVPGQVLPGVPVWILGEGSRLPGIPFVVFPGNVGDANSLARVIEILRE